MTHGTTDGALTWCGAPVPCVDGWAYGLDDVECIACLRERMRDLLAKLCTPHAAATGTNIDRLRDSLRKAGEWVAAVDPKLPMPGVGDSQQYVLDMIEDALALAGKDTAASALGRKGGKAGTGEAKRRGDGDYYRALRAKRNVKAGGGLGGGA